MVFELPSSFTTGKVNYEAMQRIGAINTRALTRLSEVQVELTNLGLESTLEQTRLLTDVNKYGSLIAIETGLAEQYCNRLVEITNRTTSLMMQSGDEMMALVEDMFDAGEVKDAPVARAKPATAAKPKKKAAATKTAVNKAPVKKATATSRSATKRKTSKKAG